MNGIWKDPFLAFFSKFLGISCAGNNSRTSSVGPPFKFRPHYILAVWPWVSQYPCLNPSFLKRDTRIIKRSQPRAVVVRIRLKYVSRSPHNFCLLLSRFFRHLNLMSRSPRSLLNALIIRFQAGADHTNRSLCRSARDVHWADLRPVVITL